MDYEQLKEALGGEILGKPIDSAFIDKLRLYSELLRDWNKRINLTSIVEEGEIVEKHFLDCLLIAKEADLSGLSVCDIGSGGGFPGMVLALVFENASFTLVDSTAKKFLFLSEVKERLQIPNVSFHIGRIEEWKEGRESFDFATSRAFSSLSVFLEVGAPLLKKGGHLLAMKGLRHEEELLQAKKAIKALGLSYEGEHCFLLPESKQTRAAMFFRKIDETPLKYPRLWKDIVKKPL